MISGDISFATLRLLGEELAFGFDLASDNPILGPEVQRLAARLRARPGPKEEALLRRQLLYAIFQSYEGLWNRGAEIAACGQLVRLLAGLTPAQVATLAHRALHRELGHRTCEARIDPAGLPGDPIIETAGITRREPIARMIARLEDAGIEVWVASASPERIVEAVAKELYGIPPERVLGVRAVEREGRLTAEVARPVTFRQGKVDAIKKFARRRPVLAFGDAWTDFEMLTWAEHGVLIHRGKADLEAALKEAGTVLIQPRFEGESRPTPCADPAP